MTTSLEPTEAQRARWTGPTRAYVEWLERTLAERTATIAELHAGPPDSNVLVQHFGDIPDRMLGINTPVRFRLRTADNPDGWVDVHHGLGVIEVQCNGGALHIVPQSSNMVRLRIGEY